MANNQIPEDGAIPNKKPYTGPRLEVYGDLRDVTQNVKSKGLPDGGSVGPPDTSRTH